MQNHNDRYLLPPFFLVGVPRSGTTLLRMLLDLHHNIYAGPESSWIGGNYSFPEVSIRGLYNKMINDKTSPLHTMEAIPLEYIKSVFRDLVTKIISKQLRYENKQIWIEKTPDNIVQLPFLKELFPEMKVIHVIRDGRDVALSTLKTKWAEINYFTSAPRKYRLDFLPFPYREKKRTFYGQYDPRFTFFKIKKLFFGMIKDRLERGFPGNPLWLPAAIDIEGGSNLYFEPLQNTFFNSMWRWCEWTKKYERDVKELKINSITVRYESLVTNPKKELCRVLSFIGEDWDERMLEVATHSSQKIKTTDIGISSFQKFNTINKSNINKWKQVATQKEKKIARKHFNIFLTQHGYEPTK